MAGNGEWSARAVGDLLETIIDYRGKTPPKSASGIPLISAANVKGGRVVLDDPAFISLPDYEKWTRRGFTQPGDVLITTEAPAGEVAPYPPNGTYQISRRVMALRPNPKELDSGFLLYALLWSEVKQRLLSLSRGTTVPRVLKTDITDLEIPYPPLSEQKAIAEILGSLDAKIELNRRMNETLESLARSLFKSWFVDFDPVRAKMDGRPPPGLPPATAALFPDSFEQSELGLIPTGWQIEMLGDHVELQRGKTYKSKLKGTPGPFLLGLGSIERNGGFRSNKLITYGGDNPENLLVYPGDLYVSLKDVTQAADLLGAVARVPTAVTVGRMTQDTVKLVFNEDAPSRNIVYRTLLTPEYRAHCRSHATGTTNLGLARDDFLSYPLIVPPPDIEQMFDNFMGSVEGRIDTNANESETLAALRDTLLPKLLSGELRVTAADRLFY